MSLTRFPVPRDVTGERSFLGLANQLSGFVPDIAHMTVRLRELTAKKNAFLWLDDRQRECEKVKQLLTSDMVVTHFDPDMPVTVLTVASRLHGLGYALGHYVDGRFKVVSCGSKSKSKKHLHNRDMQPLSWNVSRFILLLISVPII